MSVFRNPSREPASDGGDGFAVGSGNVTREKIVEEKENKDYIEKYGHYLEEFIVVPDENEPPYLDVSYKQPEALVTAAADIIAGVPTLKLPELVELSVDGDTQAELLFSTQPENREKNGSI